ncbi:MAG: stage II sporulation protein P [Oscillospiraceae bacterium]|nr:stage II sporulation protein P [Oscillospiraceae bacterium]
MYRRKSRTFGLWILILAVLLRVFFVGGVMHLRNKVVSMVSSNAMFRLLLSVATGTEISQPQRQNPQVWVLHRAPAPSKVAPTIAPPTAEEGESISIQNATTYTISKTDAVQRQTPVSATDGPAVLIIHTHTTEAYTPSSGYEYKASDRMRTMDLSKSVVRVGEELAQTLASRGIEVLHDKTIHDYPDFNSAYTTTAQHIAQWLEKYPSIQAVIDVHRDAVEYADGTAKYLSATLADGTVSAPLMLVVGTDKGGLYHPNWQDNLAWCVKLQALLERENAGLCRPLNLRKERFNGHFTPKSFILEVGTTGNTLPEALVAVRAFGESFADLWELNTVK